MGSRHSSPLQIFLALCVVAVVTLAGTIYWAKNRGAGQATLSGATAVPAVGDTSLPGEPPAAAAADLTPAIVSAPVIEPGVAAGTSVPGKAQAQEPVPPRVFFRYTGLDIHYGKLAYVDGPKGAVQFAEPLSCEVAYVGGGKGICLTAKRGVVTTYGGKLFDSQTFKTLADFPLQGVPSRNRMSIDGKLAAYTVFLSGHGYSSLDFSTQTVLIDVETGTVAADLEADFTVTRDGNVIKEQDFNFWGVTFTPDASGFFATLSTGGKHYLVKGDIPKRTMTVIHENVECPSLSPDGKRVAYKKRFLIDNRIVWQLHVLDVASGKETSLAEQRSIDDQLEWLDNGSCAVFGSRG